MKHMAKFVSAMGKMKYLAGLTLLTVALATFVAPAEALQLSGRSLYIADVNPGATTTHTFTFSYTSPDAVGSVVFEYCTNPFFELACNAPSGVDVSGGILDQQTGEAGFSILSAQPNRLLLSRSPASNPVQNPSQYVFADVINPTGAPESFFVRMTTYASSDGSGAYIDYGAVVNSTTQNIQVSSEVPPILKFCVGLVLANDCSTADDSVVDLGDLTTARASAGSSQMIAATNAEFGLAIAAYGSTMTSGNNLIAALESPTVSAPGNAQFGINLRRNTDPQIGEEPSGIGISLPTAKYNQANKFAFTSGDVVATSPSATDSRKFTVSYLVNVPPSQTPGVYTATLTYICTATF